MIIARDLSSAGRPAPTGLGQARDKRPRTKDDPGPPAGAPPPSPARRRARERRPPLPPERIPLAIIALHGRIGDRVYKTYRRRYGRNRIIVTRVASFEGYVPTAAQRTQRERLRAATAYAQRVYADPATKAVYVAAARALGRAAFRLAIADHLAGRVRVELPRPEPGPMPAKARGALTSPMDRGTAEAPPRGDRPPDGYGHSGRGLGPEAGVGLPTAAARRRGGARVVAGERGDPLSVPPAQIDKRVRRPAFGGSAALPRRPRAGALMHRDLARRRGDSLVFTAARFCRWWPASSFSFHAATTHKPPTYEEDPAPDGISVRGALAPRADSRRLEPG